MERLYLFLENIFFKYRADFEVYLRGNFPDCKLLPVYYSEEVNIIKLGSYYIQIQISSRPLHISSQKTGQIFVFFIKQTDKVFEVNIVKIVFLKNLIITTF